MAVEVRHRRGTGAEHTTFTGASGEITVDITDNRLVVHDGVTAGGYPVAKESETASVGDKLSKDGSEAMTGNLDLGGNGLVDVGNINGGPMGGFRNKIINGDFDIWQRGTSQTLNDYLSADRWGVASSGTTKTFSQQSFTLGQTDVPGNPEFFSRNVVVSSVGASNFSILSQRIESVKTLSGKTATLTFWAKADAAKNMAVELSQSFGTGGSPSEDVNEIGSQLVALTTSWQKFSVPITIPSVNGKTLGSDGNDLLQAFFWFDAGSTYDSRTASLGQQSGTFDIAHVSIVEGDATLEDDPFGSRSISVEECLCKRYYQEFDLPNGSFLLSMHRFNAAGGNGYCVLEFPVDFRISPSFTQSGSWDSSIGYAGTPAVVSSLEDRTCLRTSTTLAANQCVYLTGGILKFDAEL